MRIEIDPERVKHSFNQLQDLETFDESRELANQGKMPVEMIQAIAMRPEILRAFAETGAGVYPGGLLDRKLKEKVIMKSSLLNECQFCVNSHRDMMRMIGIPQTQIDELEAPGNLTPKEELAVQYTAAVMEDSNLVSDELFAQIKESFSDEEIVELTYLIGFINHLNMFNNALRVTYRGDYGVDGA